MTTQILGLDIAGNPFRWLTPAAAIQYAAANKIVWGLGEKRLVFFGGMRRNNVRSSIELQPVIAIAKSDAMVRHLQTPLPLGRAGNTLLFRRDRGICAYCGERFPHSALEREHVIPKGQGGLDIWTNVVSACHVCNSRKACRTPEQAKMALIYVPYAPCRFESFILSGRRILADQMAYLAARLPKHSRLQLESA